MKFWTAHLALQSDGYIKLAQMGSRWYDSELGRFTQPDTIIPQPGNPQLFNRYTYVLNNPLRHVDPTGHMEVDPGGGGGCDLDCIEATPTPTPADPLPATTGDSQTSSSEECHGPRWKCDGEDPSESIVGSAGIGSSGGYGKGV